MKKLLCIITAILFAFSMPAFADTAAEPVSVGPYTFVPEAGLTVESAGLTQYYVYSQDGRTTANVQFFEYNSDFGMPYDELILTAGNDAAIAEMIIEASLSTTYDDSGRSMFGDIEKEYTEVNNSACVIYFGSLDPGFSEGSYCASLIVTPEGVLSVMTFTYDSAVGADTLRAFHDSIHGCMYIDGLPLTGESTGDGYQNILSNINGLIGSGTQSSGDTAVLDCIEFTAPAGWVLENSDAYLATYSCGDSTIFMNAYGLDVLFSDVGLLTDKYIADYLVSVGDSSVSQMGLDPASVNYITVPLANGDSAVCFRVDARSTSYGGYMTSAMFVSDYNTVALISVVSPMDDPAADNELIADAINMYYPAEMVQAYQIPDFTQNAADTETTPTVTVPHAAVLSVTGTSLTSEESSALTAAIIYVSGDSFSYNGLIDQLIIDGYSYDIAVFAADNCGIDWDDLDN